MGSHFHCKYILTISPCLSTGGIGLTAALVAVSSSLKLVHIIERLRQQRLLLQETAEHTYCTSVLYGAPLQGWICDKKELARNCIIFCYCMCALLMILVGGLTLWNVYLISKGITYIDYLVSALFIFLHKSFRISQTWGTTIPNTRIPWIRVSKWTGSTS